MSDPRGLKEGRVSLSLCAFLMCDCSLTAPVGRNVAKKGGNTGELWQNRKGPGGEEDCGEEEWEEGKGERERKKRGREGGREGGEADEGKGERQRIGRHTGVSRRGDRGQGEEGQEGEHESEAMKRRERERRGGREVA